jgi:CBS domain-containing protein
MTTVNQILQGKGSKEVWSVASDSTVAETLQQMIDKNIGALPVVDDGRLVGIISERDYARKVVLNQRMMLNTPIREIMTTEVCYVRPEQTLEECMALMTDKRVRHLPVLANDEDLIGLISIGDVVKAIISTQEFIIEQLEHYISGRVP